VFELVVNGERHDVDAPVGTSLAHVLREELGLTGTKVACNEGHCGACTVQVDGVPILSCLTLVHTVAGRELTTIEGLRDHPLVDAFVRSDALQCGFCTPGQIVSAAALVAANSSPSRDEIRQGMAGNICRCGTYPKIEEAILSWQG
jgi:aerobic-type carbon monoxide dehydrogenase small subunit (CoxS/CutS family)